MKSVWEFTSDCSEHRVHDCLQRGLCFVYVLGKWEIGLKNWLKNFYSHIFSLVFVLFFVFPSVPVLGTGLWIVLCVCLRPSMACLGPNIRHYMPSYPTNMYYTLYNNIIATGFTTLFVVVFCFQPIFSHLVFPLLSVLWFWK